MTGLTCSTFTSSFLVYNILLPVSAPIILNTSPIKDAWLARYKLFIDEDAFKPLFKTLIAYFVEEIGSPENSVATPLIKLLGLLKSKFLVKIISKNPASVPEATLRE